MLLRDFIGGKDDIEGFSDITDPESHDWIDEGFYDDYEVVLKVVGLG